MKNLTSLPAARHAFRFGCAEPLPADVDSRRVGNKAFHLMRMADAGLPVPPGFVLSTDICRQYFARGCQLPEDFRDLLAANMRALERASGLEFGGERRPLLVAVRSGAAASMPGMMDTILNIGLTERTLPALIRMTGNPRFVWDSYRRLLRTYGQVVLHLPGDPFDRCIQQAMQRQGASSETELDTPALRALAAEFRELLARHTEHPFPQDPLEQLESAARATLESWNGPRAVAYRRLRSLDDHAGTAVTVQTMVFGNLGGSSGAGVAFSRDPATGAPQLYYDFLWNAQGEDLVAGRHLACGSSGLERRAPSAFRELADVSRRLEMLFYDVQDLEFTLQEGRLFLLQSRSAKRTPWAALRIACDLVDERLIDVPTALDRLAPYDLEAITLVRLKPGETPSPLATGVAASPGIASGRVALSTAVAVRLAASGQPTILMRSDIATEDLAGLTAADGILTVRGSRTSHAAVVARQLNKVCVVGCSQLQIDEELATCVLGEQRLAEGSPVTIDGNSGHVYNGVLEVVAERPTAYLERVKQWRQYATTGTTANQSTAVSQA